MGLQRLQDGPQWASPSAPLFALQYQAHTEGDYEAIWSNYTYFNRSSLPWWFVQVGTSVLVTTRAMWAVLVVTDVDLRHRTLESQGVVCMPAPDMMLRARPCTKCFSGRRMRGVRVYQQRLQVSW